MPDIWAYCDRCARWFYCSRNERAAGFVCPACGAHAHVTREGRPDRPTPAADEPPVLPQQTQDA